MTYRSQTQGPIETCSLCDDEAGERCLRCGRPLCWRHAEHEPDRRCFACEQDHRESTPRWFVAAEIAASGIVVALILGVGWLVMLRLSADGQGTYGRQTPMLLIAVGALVVGPWSAIATLRKLRRARFLRERAEG